MIKLPLQRLYNLSNAVKMFISNLDLFLHNELTLLTIIHISLKQMIY